MTALRPRLSRAVPCLLVTCAASSLAILATAQTAADEPRIVPHVSVAGVDVGGLTAGEAMGLLSTRVADELSRAITLRTETQEFTVTLRDVGGRADLEGAVLRAMDVGRGETVPASLREAVDSILGSYEVDMPFALDRARARAVTEALLEEVRREARDARAEVVDGALVIQPHVVGVEPDVPATTQALIDAALRGAAEVAISVRETQPEVLTSSLEDLELVASYTTRFSTGQVNRATNIRIGSSLIDGTVVPAGAIFSVNQTTGPRSPEKGFLSAPVYSGQSVVYGVGGGVCQISTTIYNAVLEAGLKVVERHPHSMPVPYVPWGRDATIDYGSADFRFQNTSGGPLIVRTTVDGGYLTCALLGRTSAAKPAQAANQNPGSDAGGPAAGATPMRGEPLTRGAAPYGPPATPADGARN